MNKNEFIHTILPFVTKASRYLGNEVNAVKKDLSRVELTFALAFPDVYEVGMSHLGLHILYNVLNSRSDIACERVFAPWVDMETIMRKRSVPLCSLESFLPLSEFDIIGFSLEYELCYTNVLRMLELAGIPLLSNQRKREHPFIIAGGPCSFNPEPVAPFFDAIIIGEAEEVILEVCNIFLQYKKERCSKEELFDELSQVTGVYVPSLFEVEYAESGGMKKTIPLKKGHERITKRFIASLDNAPYCTSLIVPYMQIIHDRISLEIARGCTRGCRFCMAGMIYRPVRERGIEKLRQLAEKTLSSTGYEEISLASLSSGDFSGIEHLLKLLMTDHHKDRVALSFPSLRAETLTQSLIEHINLVRKTGFTIAPEAGSQRLRNVINKGITEEEILTTVERIFSAGWNLIKLYFMIGFPTETQQDLEAIIELCMKIHAVANRAKHRKQINVSISTFVPKPHTPFQWEEQLSVHEILKRQIFLKNKLNRKGIRFKWHNHHMSILEGVFSRGDRRLHNVLIQANMLGAGFDAWSEHFHPELWEMAFNKCGIDKNYYLQKRSLSDPLPWEHICCGVSIDFLKKEYQKAKLERTSPDCRLNGCQGCGLCKKKPLTIVNQTKKDEGNTSPISLSLLPPSQNIRVYRYRCKFAKFGPARFISHLELSRCMARAMKRAKLPLRYSQGFHPLARIIFHDALPVGVESLEEFLDVELTKRMPQNDISHLTNQHLPCGIKILSAEEIPLKKKPLLDKIVEKKYLITFPVQKNLHFPNAEDIANLIKEFFKKESVFITACKKNKFFQADIRNMVKRLDLKKDGGLELTLKKTDGEVLMPKIDTIIGNILQLDEQSKKVLKITKI